MRWVFRKGLHYLQFPRLSQVEGVRHAVFLRFSETLPARPGPFNLGLGCGDDDGSVWDQRRQAMGILDLDTMIFARQVHGAEVKTWPPETMHADQQPEADHVHLAGDALVTGQAGQALFIQTADCQSVLVADPKHRVVANIHCGWRGSVANIIGRTVCLMADRFDSRAENLLCGIGPSLGPCCAEFVNFRVEIPEAFWPYRLSADRFDFWRISQDQLASAGVPRKNIEVSHICTRCNRHLFFSYRGEGSTGRFAAAIGLSNGWPIGGLF